MCIVLFRFSLMVYSTERFLVTFIEINHGDFYNVIILLIHIHCHIVNVGLLYFCQISIRKAPTCHFFLLHSQCHCYSFKSQIQPHFIHISDISLKLIIKDCELSNTNHYMYCSFLLNTAQNEHISS